MGSLYWQLNDLWPVISWATVDYYGSYKAAHYRMGFLYRDVMLSVHNESDTNFYLSIVNDKMTVLTGNYSVNLMLFNGTVLQSYTGNATVG
jgi:beta-mannosidase